MTRTLLIHGFTGSARSWDPVFPSGDPSCVRVELVGHRGEREVPAPSSFEAACDAVMPAAPEPWHVIGYSLGARVALTMLLRAPERFERATLIGVQPGLETEADRAKRRADDARWIECLEREGIATFAARWERQPLLVPSETARPEDVEAARAIRRGHSAVGLAWSLRTLGLAEMPNLWPQLSNIATPVHLIVGERDEKFTAVARRMSSRLPRVKLTVVAGAGHNVLLDAPSVISEASRPGSNGP